MSAVTPQYAWVRLTRLCGCNYRQPVEVRGKSVYLTDPQRHGRTMRLDLAKFRANIRQYRGSWAISPWDDHADRIAAGEQNWQS